MDTPHLSCEDSSELRRRAEERFEQNCRNEPELFPSEEQMRRIIHELSVHQIELELQQEELLHARQELEASLIRYTGLYDFAPVGYLALGSDGTIREINLKAASLIGSERGVLKGCVFGNFVAQGHHEAFNASMKSLFRQGGSASFETRLQQNDSLPKIIRVDATISDDGSECKVVLTDITNERMVEEENSVLQANLIQAQKIEVVGQLAGGIAHDFNNMLTVIIGTSERSIHRAPDNGLKAEMEIILKAATCSASLTSQLLTFARKQLVSPQMVDINSSVEEVLPMLKGLVGANIDIVFNRTVPLYRVYIDPVQLDQILLNLCLNSRDAIKGQGTITIETRMAQVDKSGSDAVSPCLTAGQYAMLTFTDTGCGIIRENIAHIYEPFFTTKGVGQGTGLGLAVVYGIAKQNKFCIDCASEPGKGTTFTLYMPAVNETTEEKAVEHEPVPAIHRALILLVEDEPDICHLVKNLLEQQGYVVLTAGNAQSALALAEKHLRLIRLLLTDVMLPGMNGVELSTRMKDINPGLKTLFMSGYAPEIIDRYGALNDDNFLPKPFSIKALQEAVYRSLMK
jgi:two-component system, cell cycle sensor histidine kinase and response regulator CckA